MKGGDPRSRLGSITPPQTEPAVEPDQKTALEVKSNSAPLSKPSPTDRLHESHQEHVKSLELRINQVNIELGESRQSHKAECDNLNKQIVELRQRLAEKADALGAANQVVAELRTSAKSTGCLTLFAGAMIAIGGGLMSVAGSLPKIDDDSKLSATVAGFTIVVCGVLLLGVTWYLTPSSSGRRPNP